LENTRRRPAFAGEEAVAKRRKCVRGDDFEHISQTPAALGYEGCKGPAL
jgi:hypothetical protein